MLPPPTPTLALRSHPAMPDLTAPFALRQTGAFEILPGRMRGESARGVEVTRQAIPLFTLEPVKTQSRCWQQGVRSSGGAAIAAPPVPALPLALRAWV
jgi:hypothetical protein